MKYEWFYLIYIRMHDVDLTAIDDVKLGLWWRKNEFTRGALDALAAEDIMSSPP